MQNSARIISLSELGYLIALGGIAAGKQNSYAGALGAMLLMKQFPEKIFKYFGDKHIKHCNLQRISDKTYKHKCHEGSDSFWLDVVRRPAGATNCNMVNLGGDVSVTKSGMPSGHATVSSFIFTTFLIEAIIRQQSGQKVPVVLVVYSSILMLLIGFARHDLGCHTSLQIVSGMILGMVLALVFFGLEKVWLLKYPRYSEDKDKFYDLFI